LHLGQAVMLASALLALRRAGRLELWRTAVSLPLYWPLGTASALKAVAETALAPTWWDKTGHGAHPGVPPERPTAKASAHGDRGDRGDRSNRRAGLGPRPREPQETAAELDMSPARRTSRRTEAERPETPPAAGRA
ncbi:MAG: hypothetical protein AAF192_23455, partial [Pseudomonadota bacterium]